jgi:hypothetical protein
VIVLAAVVLVVFVPCVGADRLFSLEAPQLASAATAIDSATVPTRFIL